MELRMKGDFKTVYECLCFGKQVLSLTAGSAIFSIPFVSDVVVDVLQWRISTIKSVSIYTMRCNHNE